MNPQQKNQAPKGGLPSSLAWCTAEKYIEDREKADGLRLLSDAR